jgi:mRNA interferase MazF
MQNYSKHDIVLVRYPFSDLSDSKVRPAIVVSAPHLSKDVFIVPLTSKLSPLLSGEFVLENWETSGLNVPSAVKRGLYTIQQNLIVRTIGILSNTDVMNLDCSLRDWLGF